tara:strand:+ start:189 stop:1436 length:1248 start_codon:yes stop_codon:yes gene_type:complete
MQLTNDQEDALLTIKSFLLDDSRKEMLLTGNSGSGKSTLVRHLINHLPEFLKPAALLKGYEVRLYPYLSATTNEAATVLSNASNMEAKTVHSLFKFRFQKNYRTGELNLVTKDAKYYSSALIVVDEASMCSTELRESILEHTCNHSKILYVGDSEQLETIKAECDIFSSGLTVANLTTNVRQSGNEIAELGLRFRDAVLTGVLPKLTYQDSEYIKYISGEEFNKLVDDKFSKENYDSSSKILAYSNSRVIEYNNHVRQLQNGCDGYVDGEILTTNNTITSGENVIAKNNENVLITDIERSSMLGMDGYKLRVCGDNNSCYGFIPDDPKHAKKEINNLAKEKRWGEMFDLQDKILDLRPRFASTVHKAQGGTLEEVFIDLNDISSIRSLSAKKKARALYVGITRAKSKVYLYGELR